MKYFIMTESKKDLKLDLRHQSITFPNFNSLIKILLNYVMDSKPETYVVSLYVNQKKRLLGVYVALLLNSL